MDSSHKHDSSRQLRLVGVADGEELVLSNNDGEEYYLPINDALRNATTRPIGRPSAAAADKAATELSPREIQAMLRAGTTIDELEAQYNTERDSLEVYATPIIAERDWIARQAQDIEVAAPQLGNHQYEEVFGDEPALLRQMVDHRLKALGIDTGTVQWDAWKDQGAQVWTISADFSTQGTADTSVGDLPPALWSYKPQSKHLENVNRWAQVISEFAPADTPLQYTLGKAPLSSVSHESSDLLDTASRQNNMYQADESHEQLLDVLHARRGQRLGVDEESDDELATLITRDEHPEQPQRPTLVVSHDFEETPSSPVIPLPHKPSEPAPSSREKYSEIPTSSAEEIEGQTDAFDEISDESTGEALKKTESSSRARKRPTVPSWDEIIFGTRKDK